MYDLITASRYVIDEDEGVIGRELKLRQFARRDEHTIVCSSREAVRFGKHPEHHRTALVSVIGIATEIPAATSLLCIAMPPIQALQSRPVASMYIGLGYKQQVVQNADGDESGRA